VNFRVPEKRYAVLTGAGGGLGRAIALRLASDRWHIAAADISEAAAAETVQLVRDAGGDGQTELLDVRDPTQWEALRDRLQAAWPQLDLLVNNAGVAGAGEVGEYPLDDWQRLMETNLWGTVYGCHTMVDWLAARHGTHLVNIASIAAHVSAPAMAAYNVAKSGVVSLSETLYCELMPRGVGVTVVCPGFFASRLLDAARFGTDEQRDAAQWLMARSQITAEQVAEAAVRGMRRKRLYVVLGWRARLLWRLKRFLPGLFMWLLARNVHPQPREQAVAESSKECGK